jgi:16S rRNA (cytidine1402-2'-O)-methyltransferase
MAHSRPASGMPLSAGLYIVATPIGNLGDISARATDILRRADAVICEDSRVTAKLMRHIGASRPLIAFHDHSSDRLRDQLVARLASESLALVTDAGTPLVSDPGHALVTGALAAGHAVTTAPGPCAAIAALSIAGLPANRFFFQGFLPTRAAARDAAIAGLATVPGTLLFHETGPRLAATLAALAQGLGDRPAAVARELTKLHEEVVRDRLSGLAKRYADAAPRGEIVVLVGPRDAQDKPAAAADELDAALLRALLTMPPGRAAASVASAFGMRRGDLYARALALAAEAAP